MFLSWSGERSKLLAQAFDKWIQSVIQAVKPFFSPDDVEKGSFWFGEINEILREAKTGVIFVTPENKDRPWLLFEAGALSAKFGKPRIIPLLFDLQPSDLVGPLPNLNAAVFSKDEVKRVVTSINAQLGEGVLEARVLDDVFDKWWPDLEAAVRQAMEKTGESDPVPRRPEEILEEVLALTRSNQRQLFHLEQAVYRQAKRTPPANELIRQYPNDVVRGALEDLPSELRDAVILVDLENLKVSDATEVLGCPISTLRVRLHAGRRALLDMLTQRYGNDVLEG